MQRAGWIFRLDQAITFIFHSKITKITEDVLYVVLFWQNKFHVLPENPCSPTLPAFTVGRRLASIQCESEQNNRPMSCSWEPRLPHFSRIIQTFGSNMGQMSIFPAHKFSLHQLAIRFSNLEEHVCLEARHQVHRPTALPQAHEHIYRKLNGKRREPTEPLVYTQQ